MNKKIIIITIIVCSLLGIGGTTTYLLIKNNEDKVSNSFIDKKVLSSYGIEELPPPEASNQLSKGEHYIFAMNGDKSYFLDYANDVFSYLKKNFYIENIYFKVDQTRNEVTSNRTDKKMYLFKCDDNLYNFKYFSFDDIFPTIIDDGFDFYYTLKKDKYLLYEISLNYAVCEYYIFKNFDNENGGVINTSGITLKKHDFYVEEEVDSIVYSTEYVILPKVEKVSIDNDNFSTYFKVDNGWIFNEDSKKLGTNFLVHNNLRKFCDAWFKVDFAYEEQTFTITFCLNKSDLIYYPYKYFTFDIEGEFDRNKASYNVTIIKNGYLYNLNL